MKIRSPRQQFLSSYKEWIFLPAECFPLIYDLSAFKSRIGIFYGIFLINFPTCFSYFSSSLFCNSMTFRDMNPNKKKSIKCSKSINYVGDKFAWKTRIVIKYPCNTSYGRSAMVGFLWKIGDDVFNFMQKVLSAIGKSWTFIKSI